MGAYGLKGISEIFGGKVPGLKAPEVTEGSNNKDTVNKVLKNELNLKQKGQDMHSKIFGINHNINKPINFGRVNSLKPISSLSSLKPLGNNRAYGFERNLRQNVTSNTERISWNNIQKNKVLPPFGDFDKDGVMNVYDCDPRDAHKQGEIHKVLSFLGGKGYTDPTQHLQNPPTAGQYAGDIARNTFKVGGTIAKGVGNASVKLGESSGILDTEEEKKQRALDRDLQKSQSLLRLQAQMQILKGAESFREERNFEAIKRQELQRTGIPYVVVNGRALTAPELQKMGGIKESKNNKKFTIENPYEKIIATQPYEIRLGQSSQQKNNPFTAQGYLNFSAQHRKPTGWDAVSQAIPGTYEGNKQKIAEGFAITGGEPQTLIQASAVHRGQGIQDYENKVNSSLGISTPGIQEYRNRVLTVLGQQPEPIQQEQQFEQQNVQQQNVQQQNNNPTYSPYSKKSVTYVRGPYRKHVQYIPQQQ